MEAKAAVDRADKVVGFFSKHWGEMAYLYSLIMKFIGKGDTDTTSGPSENIKGGLFRDGDEKKIIRLWTELTKDEKEIIIGLLEYEFGNLDHPKHVLLMLWSIRQNNRWRTIITDLDQSSQKTGSEKRTFAFDMKHEAENQPQQARGRRLINNDRVTINQEEDVYSGSKAYSNSFLKHLVKLVRSEARQSTKSTEEERQRDGYAAAWQHMKALGLPGMPSQETMAWIDEYLRLPSIVDSYEKMSTSTPVTSLNGWLDKKANEINEREQNMSPLRRWFRSIL